MTSGRTSQFLRYTPHAVAALAIALCAVSTFISLWQVFASYQPIFFSDQWETVELLDKILRGAATLNDFAAQHNEHRILIPRLVFVLDLMLAGARNSVNFASILICQALHAILFHRLIARRIDDLALRWALTAFVALLLFCIVQRENLLWGFQIGFVGVFLFYTFAAYMLAGAQVQFTGTSRAIALVAGLTAGAGAALMISNGATALLCIGLVFAAAGFLNPVTATTAFAGAFVLTAYLGYFTPIAGHASLGSALVKPAVYLEYIGIFLGSVLAPLGLAAARMAGLAGLALSLLAGVALLTGRLARDRTNLTLVAIVAFVVLTAALSGLGRVNFGVEQAAASRYATPSAVFWAALGVLAVCTLYDTRPGRRIYLGLTTLIAMAIVALASITASQGEFAVHLDNRNRNFLSATDSILSGVYDVEMLNIVYNDPRRMRETLLPLLKERKLNIFSRPLAFELGSQVPPDRILSGAGECLGHLDVLERLPGPSNAVSVQGWGWDTQARRPLARLVFLGEDRRVIGYGSSSTQRADVALHVPATNGARIAWLGFANRTTGTVAAYGVTRRGAMLCEIGTAAIRLPPVLAMRAVEKPDDARLRPVETAPVLSGNWAANGQPPNAGAPPWGGQVHGSWNGADAFTGMLTYRDVRFEAPAAYLSMTTGPSTDGLEIQLLASGRNTILASARPPVTPHWTLMALELPPDLVGQPIDVRIVDHGTGGGQWLAVGGLYAQPH